MKFDRLLAVAGAGVVALGLVSCSATGGKPRDSGDGAGGGTVDTPRITIAMITHQAPGDTFWDLVRKGAEDAARKDNVELRYSADPDGAGQSNLVQTAIDTKVDGIAVTLAKPDAMRPAVMSAVDAKIPVVGINSGLDKWKAMGITEFFGQDEFIAGQAAGDRLNTDGAKKVLCVIQEQGNVGLEERCRGVKDRFAATENLNVNGKDMTSVEATITAKLQQDPAVDSVLTLGAPFALTAAQSVKNSGSPARVFTFDTNAALVDAIKGGDVQWAVDQQPYLQGYLAIDSLWLFTSNGNVIGGGEPTLTGPSFIDRDNIDAVAQYAKDGRR